MVYWRENISRRWRRRHLGGRSDSPSDAARVGDHRGATVHVRSDDRGVSTGTMDRDDDQDGDRGCRFHHRGGWMELAVIFDLLLCDVVGG
jgi:hypothetical protein